MLTGALKFACYGRHAEVFLPTLLLACYLANEGRRVVKGQDVTSDIILGSDSSWDVCGLQKTTLKFGRHLTKFQSKSIHLQIEVGSASASVCFQIPSALRFTIKIWQFE